MGKRVRWLYRRLTTSLPLWWSCRLFAGAEPTGPGKWSWAAVAALALVAGPLLFLNRSYPLLEPDEGRYAEVAREMLAGGDWLVPTLNHVPFLDKPPLFYWLEAASFRVFGVTAAAARLVPALAAFLTVFAVYLFGRRLLGQRAGFLAGLALAVTGGFVQCGRIVILDSVLTLCVTAALLVAYEAVRTGRLRWGWWLTSAGCCALGVLTKGPVALVLVGPPVAVAAWLERRAARPRVGHWVAYGGLVLALVAPAYAAVIVRDPDFAYRFFIDQHLVRFFMKEYHLRPFWYYGPVLLVGCLPGSLLLLAVGRFLAGRTAADRAARPAVLGFCLLWAGWCVLFFSVSRSKLPPYVLPALPAVALVVGCYLDRALAGVCPAARWGRDPGTMPRLALACLAVIWIAMAVGTGILHLVGPAGAAVRVVLAGAALVAAVTAGRRLPAPVAWLACAAVGGILAAESAHGVVPTWARRHDPLASAPAIAGLLRDADTGLVGYGGEWGSLPFYVGGEDRILNGSDRPPADMQAFFGKHPRSLVVAHHPQDLERLWGEVPPGMTVEPVGAAGEVRVVLVRPVTPADGGAQ